MGVLSEVSVWLVGSVVSPTMGLYGCGTSVVASPLVMPLSSVIDCCVERWSSGVVTVVGQMERWTRGFTGCGRVAEE